MFVETKLIVANTLKIIINQIELNNRFNVHQLIDVQLVCEEIFQLLSHQFLSTSLCNISSTLVIHRS